MNEVIPLDIVLSDGSVRKCALRQDNGPPLRIALEGIHLPPNEFSGRDLFDALCSLRKALEHTGAKALCAGARRDVFPSGMSREMSNGRKAYIIRIGSPASPKDIVDIFERAAPELIGTVAEQSAHHAAWVNHFRR
jgi:hypothetical protein